MRSQESPNSPKSGRGCLSRLAHHAHEGLCDFDFIYRCHCGLAVSCISSDVLSVLNESMISRQRRSRTGLCSEVSCTSITTLHCQVCRRGEAVVSFSFDACIFTVPTGSRCRTLSLRDLDVGWCVVVLEQRRNRKHHHTLGLRPCRIVVAVSTCSTACTS